MFVVVFLGLIVWWRAAQEWQRIERVPLGDYVGPATLVGDPSPFGAGVRAVFRIDGWRYEASFYGSDARRVLRHLQGETVQMSARREALSGDAMRRKQVRHIAGRLVDVELGTEWTTGSALTRATNRLRRLVASGTAHLPSDDDAALALGLLIGDDRAQPRAMIDAFRDSGLSHLTAVSGQNIAFVLAASAPLLTRLGPGKRLAATWAVIAVFALITRAEPSVIRAAAMAGTTALCFTRGWNVTSRIVLVASATVLVIVDPMLLWSVGFWLSVGATAGLVFLSAPIARGLRRARLPRVLEGPLSATLAAQVGTLAPMLWVFGRVAPIGIVANLLAVPVAGAVMLVGLPVCIVAGLIGGTLGDILTVPVMLGVRWVWWVAVVGQRLS
jgi:competence protein ComEC